VIRSTFERSHRTGLGRDWCVRHRRIEVDAPRGAARSFFVSHTRRTIVQTYEDTDTAVKVVYGVNELSLDLGGKSIRGIWKMLEQVLNLPRETTVRVNGQIVADDHIVRPGDEIDFLKPAGVKGLAA
jgi:sulfur carrier protein ThiS